MGVVSHHDIPPSDEGHYLPLQDLLHVLEYLLHQLKGSHHMRWILRSRVLKAIGLATISRAFKSHY